MIGDLFYGCSFGHLESGEDLHGWLAAIETFLRFITVHASLPGELRLLHGMWQQFTNKNFRGRMGVLVGISNMSMERVSERQTSLAAGKLAERKDLLAKFMDMQKEKKRSDWQIPDIQQEGFVAM